MTTSPRRPTVRSSCRGAAVVLALTGALAACSDEEQPAGEGPEPASVSAGATLQQQQTWPLTGARVGSGSVAKERPVLVVKIDNSTSSAPQVGLSQADLVVEELVEGGTTRLAAFFYQQLPARVGPVRSMRASDIGIVSPVGADVVTSGAAPQTIARLQRAGVRFFNEGAPGMSRDAGRTAPYNLFDDLRRTAAEARTDKATRPEDYLPWAEPGDSLPRGRAAAGLSAVFSGSHTTTWRYDATAAGGDGGYVNENSNAGADDQFPTDSVLVLRVEVGDAGYTDPAGNPVPETRLTGSGAASLFHGGREVRGTWIKKGLDSPLTLSTGRGNKATDLEVPPGHTWIELVPRSGGSLTVRR